MYFVLAVLLLLSALFLFSILRVLGQESRKEQERWLQRELEKENQNEV